MAEQDSVHETGAGFRVNRVTLKASRAGGKHNPFDNRNDNSSLRAAIFDPLPLLVLILKLVCLPCRTVGLLERNPEERRTKGARKTGGGRKRVREGESGWSGGGREVVNEVECRQRIISMTSKGVVISRPFLSSPSPAPTAPPLSTRTASGELPL